jgi:chromosome segregation ATPase
LQLLLQGANQHLRQRLQEALSELHAAKLQLDIRASNPPSAHSDFFQNIDSQATPPRSATSAQAHAEQEARDARVLSLLRAKDEALEGLEARCAETTAEAATLQSQLTSLTRKYDTNQVRLDEMLQANSKLVREAGDREDFHASAASQLQAEVTELRSRVAEESTIAAERDRAVADLASARDQLEALGAAAQAADALVEDLHCELSTKETALAASQRHVVSLRGYVSHLIGVAADEVPTPALEEAEGEMLDSSTPTVESLTAANAALERALVDATARLAAAQPLSAALVHQHLAPDEDGAEEEMVQTLADHEHVNLFGALVAKVGALRHRLATVEASESETRLELMAALEREGQAADAVEQGLLSLAAVEEEKIHLAAGVEAKAAEVEALTAEVGVLKAAAAEERTALGNAASALTALQTAHDGCLQRVTEMESDLKSTSAELAGVKTELGACSAQVEEATARCTQLQTDLAETVKTRDAAVSDSQDVLHRLEVTKDQLLHTLDDTVKLTAMVCELESHHAVAAAQLAAQEAAGCLLRQWSEGRGCGGSGDVGELAKGLQAATLAQLEGHQEAETLKM